MKINSSPYIWKDIPRQLDQKNKNKNNGVQLKLPRKAFKILQKLKNLVNKINNIQEPGNSKKQETKENPKSEIQFKEIRTH